MFDEHIDVRVTRDALQQVAWRLVIPTTGHSCRQRLVEFSAVDRG